MRLAKWTSVYGATLSVAAAACSTDSASPSDAAAEGPGASSSGGSSGGGSSSLEGGTCAFHENDAGTCSDVPLLGAPVETVCVSGEPPQPQGGTVEDGTYVLDSYVGYGACVPSDGGPSQTWAICGNRWDFAYTGSVSPDGGAGAPGHINIVAQTQGSTVTFIMQGCASPLASPNRMPIDYTATPSKLMFIFPYANDPNTAYVQTFLRR